MQILNNADIYDDEALDNQNFLHIYGQHYKKEDIVIVGNHAALIQLHRALTSAINKGEWKTSIVYCGDGEGYKIVVKDVGGNNLGSATLPYFSL